MYDEGWHGYKFCREKKASKQNVESSSYEGYCRFTSLCYTMVDFHLHTL